MREFPPQTAVVIHDAGAANHIIAWIDAGLIPAHRIYAEGPAAALWSDTSRCLLAPSLDAALQGAEALLTGTGWQSSLEHDARGIAASRGMQSFAVLDHWVNFAGRFVRDGVCILPETLLVTDREAEMIAIKAFPGVAVRHMPNAYLDRQLLAIAAISAAAQDSAHATILAIMEPARDDWGRCIAGEFQALDYLVAHWKDAGFPADAMLLLRQHPSDPEGKYDKWINDCSPVCAALSVNRSLAEDIAFASAVVGLGSYAMTIALAAGRTVWSILPPWAPECALPHAEIRHLRALPAMAS